MTRNPFITILAVLAVNAIALPLLINWDQGRRKQRTPTTAPCYRLGAGGTGAYIPSNGQPSALTLCVMGRATTTLFDDGRIIINCGEGKAVIDTVQGTATYENCTPDEAARAFYEALASVDKPGKTW